MLACGSDRLYCSPSPLLLLGAQSSARLYCSPSPNSLPGAQPATVPHRPLLTQHLLTDQSTDILPTYLPTYLLIHPPAYWQIYHPATYLPPTTVPTDQTR
ncbi:hypothetical protein CRUP_037619 [Coryphaenoides rupestris]|nr:hypothetical protein CRUP_037619 [Coryphaenoides rupestris]